MSSFLKAITSSNWGATFTLIVLALASMHSVAGLIVPDNKATVSGQAQERVHQIKQGNHDNRLDKVIKIKVNNINSPEFPKGFEVEVKNVSSKPNAG